MIRKCLPEVQEMIHEKYKKKKEESETHSYSWTL